MSDDTCRSTGKAPRGRPEVWAERYPGSDVQIEVDSMDNVDELYLMGSEADALREILNGLEEQAETGPSNTATTQLVQSTPPEIKIRPNWSMEVCM